MALLKSLSSSYKLGAFTILFFIFQISGAQADSNIDGSGKEVSSTPAKVYEKLNLKLDIEVSQVVKIGSSGYSFENKLREVLNSFGISVIDSSEVVPKLSINGRFFSPGMWIYKDSKEKVSDVVSVEANVEWSNCGNEKCSWAANISWPKDAKEFLITPPEYQLLWSVLLELTVHGVIPPDRFIKWWLTPSGNNFPNPYFDRVKADTDLFFHLQSSAQAHAMLSDFARLGDDAIPPLADIISRKIQFRSTTATKVLCSIGTPAALAECSSIACGLGNYSDISSMKIDVCEAVTTGLVFGLRRLDKLPHLASEIEKIKKGMKNRNYCRGVAKEERILSQLVEYLSKE